jgi:hypothetical protein
MGISGCFGKVYRKTLQIVVETGKTTFLIEKTLRIFASKSYAPIPENRMTDGDPEIVPPKVKVAKPRVLLLTELGSHGIRGVELVMSVSHDFIISRGS